MRVKVFVYDFLKDKILGAKLQEFTYYTPTLGYKPSDELLSTSPVIIGNWDIKGLVEKAKVDEKIEKILIKKIEGPENVFEEKEYEFKIVEWSKKEIKLKELIPKIKWGYTVDAGKLVYITTKALIDKKNNQIVLKWKVPKVEGAKIAVSAWLEQRSEGVKVEFNIVRFPFYFDRYKLKGMNTEMTQIADDLCYGDGVNKTEHFRYTRTEIENLGWRMRLTSKQNEIDLWEGLKEMATTFFSVKELEKVILMMFKNFKENRGDLFTNNILTPEVIKHQSTVNFCIKIEESIKQKLLTNKNDFTSLFNNTIHKTTAGKNRYGRPQFSTLDDTFFSGLTICINDTWAYEIFIIGVFLDSKKNINIKYKVILYDHFGLDIPDIKNDLYYSLVGFRSWFVLQHLKNYKPFITKIEFEKTFRV